MSSRDRVVAFVLATYLMSAMLALTFYFVGMRMVGSTALVMGGVYMFVPLVVAITLQRLVLRASVRDGLGLHFKLNLWFGVALLLPIVLGALTLGVALLLPGVSYAGFEGLLDRGAETLSPAHRQAAREAFAAISFPPLIFIALKAVAAGPTINALAALGEEVGWRGFLYANLRGSFVRTSLVTGVIWGIWHVPLVLMGLNTTGPAWLSVITTIAFTTLLAPLCAYIRERSGSTIAVAIFHGTINASASMSLLARGDSALVGPTALAGLLALLILNALFAFYDLRISKNSLLRRADVHTP